MAMLGRLGQRVSAASFHMLGSRTWLPGWNEIRPHRAREPAEIHQPQRLASRAAELAAERPIRLGRLDQHAHDDAGAGRQLGDLADLRLGIGRELLDADRMGPRRCRWLR